MNLCIDIGNTQTKVAIYKEEALVYFERVTTIDVSVLNEILLKFDVKHAIISSVRAEDKTLISFLKTKLKLVLRLSAALKLPIINDYETPQTLGNDRLAVAVGATVLFPNEHVLVVDAGTCITYDFVKANKTYLGGSILPGIDMRFKALEQLTAKLPLVKRQNINDFVGKTTETSILTGILYGVLHELEGFKRQYEQKFGNIQLIVTGGDCSYFESQLKNEIFAQPKLVLIGLNKILDYNRQ